MDQKPLEKLADKQQGWLKPLGEKSDAFMNGALDSVGSAGEAVRDSLVNSRILGHTRHPTVTDIPLGSWTVTLVSDVLELTGNEQCSTAADTSLTVGLIASLAASLGGLADLTETHQPEERRLGMMHGILHGLTTVLYGGSLAARRFGQRGLGKGLSFAGYGTLLASAYLANELVEHRRTTPSHHTPRPLAQVT